MNNNTSYKIENGILYITSEADELIRIDDSNIVEIVVRDGIKSLKNFDLYCPNAKKVTIPESIDTMFYQFSFLGIADYHYKEIKLDGMVANKQSMQQSTIMKILKLSEIESLDRVLNIPPEILRLIPVDSEIVKSFTRNRKRFDFVLDNIQVSYPNIWKIYTISNALGLFNEGDPNIVNKVIEFINKYDKVLPRLNTTEVNKYDKSQSALIFELAEKDLLVFEDDNVLHRVLTEYKRIKNYTRLRKSEENYRSEERTNEKHVDAVDVLKYIKTHKFHLNDENSDLDQVIDFILSYGIDSDSFLREGFPELTQEIVDKIQRLYEKSKSVKKNLPFTVDKEDGYTYEWLESSDIRNVLLPYITHSCTKIGGKGEKNLEETMVNPNVINLIIKNPDGEILGKTTAYYNSDGGYVLFNNFEGAIGNNYETAKLEIVIAIARAANDLMTAMREQGVPINTIRMGTGNNKLSSELSKHFELQEDDLLPNCKMYSADEADVSQYVLSNGELIDIDRIKFESKVNS